MKVELIEAKETYDRTSPHLACELDAVAPLWNGKLYVDGKLVPQVGVVVTPMLLNTGAPSVARKFTLIVTLANGYTENGEPVLINGPIQRQTDGGVITYNPSDSITEKSNTPIPGGGEQTGVILFEFKGISDYSDIERDAVIELSFMDVAGKVSSCKLTTNGRNSHGLEAMPNVIPKPI